VKALEKKNDEEPHEENEEENGVTVVININK